MKPYIGLCESHLPHDTQFASRHPRNLGDAASLRGAISKPKAAAVPQLGVAAGSIRPLRVARECFQIETGPLRSSLGSGHRLGGGTMRLPAGVPAQISRLQFGRHREFQGHYPPRDAAAGFNACGTCSGQERRPPFAHLPAD